MRITISVLGMPKVRRTRALFEALEQCVKYVVDHSDWKPDAMPEIRFLDTLPPTGRRNVLAHVEALDNLDYTLKQLAATLVDSALEAHAPPGYSTACHVCNAHFGVEASACTLAAWRKAA